MLHDFPWGWEKAAWDVRMDQDAFNLRVSACDQLNTFDVPVSFALCSFLDIERVQLAYEAAQWSSTHYLVIVDKLDVVEPTHDNVGLINHLHPAVVSFKAAPGDSYWNFPPHPDERRQRWAVPVEKRKFLDPTTGEVVNPTEQPIAIDMKAMRHWSKPGDWIFVDGFGSGSSFLAGLREARNMVGTEPDEAQFRAACTRLSGTIKKYQESDLRAMAKRAKKEKLKQEALELAKKGEKLAVRSRKMGEVSFCSLTSL